MEADGQRVVLLTGFEVRRAPVSGWQKAVWVRSASRALIALSCAGHAMRWRRMVSVLFCSLGSRPAEETKSSRTKARASSSFGQVRAQKPDQRRFGAVGDHLDGVR